MFKMTSYVHVKYLRTIHEVIIEWDHYIVLSHIIIVLIAP